MMATAVEPTERPGGAEPRRVLILVDGTERTEWGLAYAARRSRSGPRPGVVLLYVADPLIDWETLRFRTQNEVAGFQQEHGRALLDHAAEHLRATGVDCETHFRVGRLPQEIVDAADVLHCDAIVLPAERPLLLRLFERDIAHEVRGLGCGIPVITVDAVGKPVGDP